MMKNEIASLVYWDRVNGISPSLTAEKIILLMTSRQYVEAAGCMLPLHQVDKIDLNNLMNGEVHVHLNSGEIVVAEEFEAFRIAMMSQNLEGKPLRWVRHKWAIHNLIAHPLMQILVWIGCRKSAMWVHDITSPKPIGLRKKK
jgi:hypothetical protein